MAASTVVYCLLSPLVTVLMTSLAAYPAADAAVTTPPTMAIVVGIEPAATVTACTIASILASVCISLLYFIILEIIYCFFISYFK